MKECRRVMPDEAAQLGRGAGRFHLHQPSVISIERDDSGADVLTYRNESGRELGCMVNVGSKAIIDQAEDTARRITNPCDWFTSLNNENPESPTAYGAAIRPGS